MARKVARYLCQELCAAKLTDIATQFQLGNIGAASFITHRVRQGLIENAVVRGEIEQLIASICSHQG
jgi:putative transposase